MAKFRSSEIGVKHVKLVYTLMSRDEIRPKVKFCAIQIPSASVKSASYVPSVSHVSVCCLLSSANLRKNFYIPCILPYYLHPCSRFSSKFEWVDLFFHSFICTFAKKCDTRLRSAIQSNLIALVGTSLAARN